MNDFQSIDASVIRMLAQGSKGAYVRVCKHYESPIFTLVLDYLKSNDDQLQSHDLASRIVTEVFASVWNCRYEFSNMTAEEFEFCILCLTKLAALKVDDKNVCWLIEGTSEAAVPS